MNHDEVTAQAQRWYLRLNDPAATADDRKAFHAWRAANPACARAYAEMESLWGKLGDPARALGTGGWYRASVPRRRWIDRTRALALAASIALVAVAIWWHDPGLAVRMLAEHATAPGTHETLTLADGSRIYLDGDSAVDVSLNETSREITLERGRAWFDVTHDERRPFRVRAGDAAVRVLGTAFAVERLPDSTVVTVERGRVAAQTRSADPPVQLLPGDRLQLRTGAVPRPERVSPETALAWRRGRIVFDRATLATVAEELTRSGAGRVVILDSQLRDKKLSGVFRTDDPRAILDAVEAGLGVSITRIPGVVIVMK